MCTTRKPKPQPVPQDQNKPVQYLSNPWVDGLGIVGADARGRNSLRIDKGTTLRAPVNVTPALPPGTRQLPNPNTGINLSRLPSYKLFQLGLIGGTHGGNVRDL